MLPKSMSVIDRLSLLIGLRIYQLVFILEIKLNLCWQTFWWNKLFNKNIWRCVGGGALNASWNFSPDTFENKILRIFCCNWKDKRIFVKVEFAHLFGKRVIFKVINRSEQTGRRVMNSKSRHQKRNVILVPPKSPPSLIYRIIAQQQYVQIFFFRIFDERSNSSAPTFGRRPPTRLHTFGAALNTAFSFYLS